MGGTDSFNTLMIRRSFLSEALPVDFANGSAGIAAAEPMPLRLAGEDADDAYGLVQWYTPSTPREGSTVLAYAGSQAVAVERKFGKGIVVVFTGTVLGDATDDGKPFWETPAWPRLFRRMLGIGG